MDDLYEPEMADPGEGDLFGVLEQVALGAAKCACGHEKRHHHGDGPCLAAHTLANGNPANATVCPCVAFEEVK
jgi:hypothetical protein